MTSLPLVAGEKRAMSPGENAAIPQVAGFSHVAGRPTRPAWRATATAIAGGECDLQAGEGQGHSGGTERR